MLFSKGHLNKLSEGNVLPSESQSTISNILNPKRQYIYNVNLGDQASGGANSASEKLRKKRNEPFLFPLLENPQNFKNYGTFNG